MPAVLATCATPAVFPLVELNGSLLADGGVINSLATHVAFEQGADWVIAVDIHPPLEKENPWPDPIRAATGLRLPFGLFGAKRGGRAPNFVAVTWRAAQIMAWHVHKQRLLTHPPDILLQPKVETDGTFDLRNLNGPRLAGMAEAEHQLATIRAVTNNA